MSYEDAYLQGSIDGVPFYTDSWQTTPGRSTKVHRFYGRDLPWVEDTGKGPYRLQGNIFLAGSNYHLERDKLRAVFDKPGPYRLYDPYRGYVTVRLEAQPTFVEERVRAGMVRIGSLSLIQTADDEPTIYITGKGKVTNLAGAALATLAENTTFSLGVQIPGAPAAGAFANNKTLASILGAIRSATRTLSRIDSKITGLLGVPSNFAFAVSAFDSALNDLLNTPAALMGQLTGLVNTAMSVVKTFEALVPTIDVDVPEFPVVEAGASAIRDAVAFETEPAEAEDDDVQGFIEGGGHREITLQMNAAAVIAGSDMATDLPFTSGQQAVAMAGQLAEGFGKVLAAPSLPPETYEAIAALRSEAIIYLLNTAAQLPQIETVVLRVVTPALVMAWDLYQDPTRALELGRRNGVDHHGFMPAGVPLEVIADA